MSITEELKTWVSAYPWREDSDEAEARALINRIDAAHQREVDKARMDAFAMPNHRVALPLDIDGVPIHLGDEIYHIIDPPSLHRPVEAMTLTEKGWEIEGGKPSELQHWTVQTVDALLMQFVVDAADTASVTEMAALVDDYTERIREAVEHEEDK